jgi:hypothetical protein
MAKHRLPKLDIEYAWGYDAIVHAAKKQRFGIGDMAFGRRFATRFRKEIKPTLNSFLAVAEKESGLRWRQSQIKCYVVHGIDFDIEDPLTIKIMHNGRIKNAVETLYHELIHLLIEQNKDHLRNQNYLTKKYRSEPLDVRDHIFDQAVMWKVYNKFFGPKKTKRIIASYRNMPEHMRAWRIIKKEGVDRIINAYMLNQTKTS